VDLPRTADIKEDTVEVCCVTLGEATLRGLVFMLVETTGGGGGATVRLAPTVRTRSMKNSDINF
jgi:hypothetical protein